MYLHSEALLLDALHVELQVHFTLWVDAFGGEMGIQPAITVFSWGGTGGQLGTNLSHRFWSTFVFGALTGV